MRPLLATSQRMVLNDAMLGHEQIVSRLGVVLVLVGLAGLLGGLGFWFIDLEQVGHHQAHRHTRDRSAGLSGPITPLPLVVDLDRNTVVLGRRLFNDPALSGDGTISCATCHALTTGGVDRRPVSIGIGGRKGVINAPTVFNSGYNFRQFWDGRAATLEAQVEGPIHNPDEMGSTLAEAVKRLSKNSTYMQVFRALYPERGLTAYTLSHAIATFERSLVTPNSAFDRFLGGDAEAMTPTARAGWRLFQDVGCVACHQGVNIGGNLYSKLGLMADYFEGRVVTTADYGRFNVTGDPEDRFVFKVPGLRNVAVTPPYMHDGQTATLSGAVELMGRYELGRPLTETEVGALVAFLKALTGEYEGQVLR